MTREEVVTEAREWLDTPYHVGASLKNVGCDCIGPIIGIGRHFGLPEADAFEKDIRFRGYSQMPNPRLLLQACDEYMDRISIADALPGDIALGRIEKEPQHFCIISSLNPTRVIHSYTQVGKVVENIVDERWKKRLLRMYRLRGIE